VAKDLARLLSRILIELLQIKSLKGQVLPLELFDGALLAYFSNAQSFDGRFRPDADRRLAPKVYVYESHTRGH
jgi:hypothetical protein